MKQTASKQRGHLLRVTQIALASAAFALLAACGGGGDSNNSSSSTPAGGVKLQVVSFGDSLSDVGTYAPVIQADFGGGRFTTNPGEVWTQKVAEYYGGTLTAAFLGGFGQPLAAAGGLGYAQGGSDVSNPQGEGWAPNNLAATTWPVTQQVSTYLSVHGSFNANQLVLINGGANDILQQLSTILTTIETSLASTPNPTPQQVQAAVVAATQTALQPVAVALATQVGTILASGATHVAVMNVPDIGQAPLALQVAAQEQNPAIPQLISGIVQTYNTILQGALAQGGLTSKIIWIDSFTWIDGLLSNIQAQGFTTGSTGTACNIALMAQNATNFATANPSVLNGLTPAQYGQQFGSSLFCSPQTYTVAGADQTFIFADTVHPSTHSHALFAQFVEQQIAASGLGK